MEKKASSFSGQIGFVLAAAGSAVGVGNLWRFPYLAAKDGGGLFLLVYLVLVLTFGFTLLTSDIAIGRRTKQSAIRAYETMRPKVEISRYPHLSGAGSDHDLLCRHRRVDHEICGGLPHRAVCCRCLRRLFHQLYHLAGVPGGVRSAVHGRNSFHRVQRRGGRH